MYRDLRGWIDILRQQGEVADVAGASWDLEIAALVEIAARESKSYPPSLLFKEIPGYPPDTRVLGALFSSPRRLAMTLGLDADAIKTKLDMVGACRRKLADARYVKPVEVETGPVAENRISADKVDLLMFPALRHRELDGGRYIGTANCVITRDPDDGWVNLGTYRCMVVGPDKYAMHMIPGRDGAIMLEKYRKRKQPMPVALAIGVDPALWLASYSSVPSGTSEYDYAGGLKGEPIEVMRGPVTGLPIPARAEIVVEGFCNPDELEPEGPFGEWAGYYANHGLEPVPEPVVRVHGILHRNAPILTCACPAKPPNDSSYSESAFRSATMWDELEKAGVMGVRGVWCHEVGGARLFNVVSIKQQFAGHSRQAGMIASQCRTGLYIGRYTIVLDDDIDPSNLQEVIWAVATRSNPERAIEITRYTRTSSADPAVSPYLKDHASHGGGYYGSKAIIDSCWPYEWKDRAYPVVQVDRQLRQRLDEKFADDLARLLSR